VRATPRRAADASRAALRAAALGLHRGTALALTALALLLAAGPASAEPTIRLSGPDNRAPIVADENGRFAFPNARLRRNSVNKFTVTATDDAGREYTKQLAITQLSLESVVVAKVTAEPLPPERVIQLVNDGVIDLEDPENFNVSLFQIVLTIGREEVPISVPIPMAKEEEIGFETVRPKSDPGPPGGNPNPPDTEVIVFDKVVKCTSCQTPPRIPGVIVIEGRIKSLKEFFSVRLLLMNVSGLFTLADVMGSIEFPEGGLSSTLPANGMVEFEDIGPGDAEVPGQAEREFIIRGDEIGTQPIRVNFGGVVSGPGIPEDDPIPFSGSADTSVEVKGPPEFLVRVSHPDRVEAGVPYDLRVEITNNGEAPALFASLDLDVGGDAQFVECQPPATPEADPFCEDVEGPITRQLQHLLPGQRATESFLIRPGTTGDISSCIGVSSQNVELQVLVGAIGCLTGKIPSTMGVPTGVPVVSVLPYPDALGVGIDSPVTAFFSEKMNLGSITLGETGSFRVWGPDGEIAPGVIRSTELNGDTVVIWQLLDGITNRLQGNAQYRIELTQDIEDEDGDALYDAWGSSFRTTDPNNDNIPPQLTLGFEPGIDPLAVVPGELVQLSAYAADQGTGVARVELRIFDQDTQGAVEQFIDQKTKFGAEAGPTIFAVDTSTLVPGHTYQLRATAIDGAGNLQDGTIPFVLTTTPLPPAVFLPEDPAAPVLQGVSLPVTPTTVSASVKQVQFFLDDAVAAFATVRLPPFQASLRTIPVAPGVHTVRAVATDGRGESAEDTLTFTLVANDSPPQITFLGAVDGARYVSGALIAVSGNAVHSTGIAQSAFFLDDPNGTPVVAPDGGVLIDTTPLAVGPHRLYLIATNNLGVSNDPANPDSYLEFVVTAVPSGDPPPPPVISSLGSPTDGEVTVSGTAPPGARVDLRNATTGQTLTVYADENGNWSGELPGAVGDNIRAVALDLTQSAQTSEAATQQVPAPRQLTSLNVLPSAFTLVTKGATQTLTVTGFYDDGSSENLTAQASFSTSSAAIASVAAGTVVAQKRGVATITATVGGVSDTSTANIEIVTLQSISVTPSPVQLPNVGTSQPLTVTGNFDDGSQQVLTTGLSFASSAPTIISVGTGGIVRALQTGSATITVARSGIQPVTVPVTVDVTLDEDPTIALLTPDEGTPFERGDGVTVVARAGDDVGVARIELSVTGAAGFAETRTLSPAPKDTDQSFAFTVPSDAAVGESITVTVQAEDTAGNLSAVASRTVQVVDVTAPVVALQAPAAEDRFNFGDEVTVTVEASDAGGLAEIRYEVTGAVSEGGSQPLSGQTAAGASFTFTIPFGVATPEASVRAFARDAAGNETASVPVPILVTDADITPPETVATAATPPGNGAVTTVSYQVTSGAEDLAHVELYFRRNGIGGFNRYTGPLGDGDGEFPPPAAAAGTIDFDATRMGGDGSYEFFTVGVDAAGNREASPEEEGAITGDPGAAASFATGAEVVTLDSDTEVPSGNLDGRSLRIDGATVTLVGQHDLANVELVNGAVLTHRETTRTEGFALDMTAWTLSVDASSRIDVVGRGYLGGGRSGLPDGQAHTAGFAPGAQAGTGGSHGGAGGRFTSNGGGVTNPVYGNLVNPVDLGAGGGSWSGDGGDGGGRVLIGAINLAVDGDVLATGGRSFGSASGEGAGGSINLTLRTLSGAGAIRADGGGTRSRTAGGGGRIAIRFLDLSTYAQSGITARGGDGFYDDGADGTIFLLPEGESIGELVINGTGPGSPFTDLILPPGQAFSSITLQNGANVIAQGPIVLDDTLRLRGGASLTHPSGDEAGLRVTARRVEIEAGSSIDVVGRGYPGGGVSGLPDSQGATLGGLPGAQAGTGGSHGGRGGRFSGNGGGITNPLYGDPKRPTRLGAGGGSWSGNGGAGGGLAQIIATEALVVDGAIRADGGSSSGSASGEGAGGSVLIQTSRLAGDGTISANGGGVGSHTAGGGGRVAIYADFVDPNANLDELRNVSAFGGDGFYDDGAAGTVFVRLSGQEDGTLYADGGFTDGSTAPHATTLPAVGPGLTLSATADTLTVDGTLPAFTPDALVGLLLSPDTRQGETFRIVGNTADTITVETPNENGVAFAALAAPGLPYAGHWRFDQVRLRRGGWLELPDPMTVGGTLSLVQASVLTHPETTQGYEGSLDVEATTLSIDGTSRIDVTGRGYLGGGRSGLADGVAHTVGFAPGAQQGTGGSHGGRGGRFTGNGGRVTNALHGSLTEPTDLGSGGGTWSGNGGDGGGRVRVVADALVVDGAIVANGGESSGSASGDGAGGSVNLDVGTLSGAGSISANGAGAGSNTGGGGGRIAIRYATGLSLPLTNVRATGGDGFYDNGGHGTVFVKGASQAFGDLVVDGFGIEQPVDSLTIPGGLSFDNVTLGNGVRAVADEGLTVLDTLRLTSDAFLSHTQGNEQGLQITARQVIVESDASIDVTGRGYPGGGNSGFGNSGATLGGVEGAARATGGSHGGRGARFVSNGGLPTNPVYGNPRQPTALGAGGGFWTTNGGFGGGSVRVTATDALVVDGALRADGGDAVSSASGDGAGGSIWLETDRIGGSGTISANGGGTGGHTGGGGGRVAIYAGFVDPNADLGGLRDVTAFGGDGFYGNGSAGTVYVELPGQPQGALFLDAGLDGTTTSQLATPLSPIGPGTAADVSGPTLTVDGALRAFTPGALVGLRLNPDLEQGESFAIVANDASTVTVATPNENGVAFGDVAATGRRYAGQWSFDEVTLRRGAFVEVADPLTVNGTLSVTEASVLTHPETTTAYEGDLVLDTGVLSVDATSAIDVTGRGYLGGIRSGLPDGQGHTVGFAPGAGAGTGGSHGGSGGRFVSNGGRVTNPLHGDAGEPLDLGSGGGSWTNNAGGDGGGRVRIVTGALVVQGAIRADGGLAGGSAAGHGAGGSVNVRAGSVSGTGAISANGGGTGGQTGGGGGRVAIRHQGLSLPPDNVTTTGGDGFYDDGEDGSVFIEP